MIVRLLFLVGLVCVILSLAILSISFFVPLPSSAAVLVADIKGGISGGGPGCHCIAEMPVDNLLIEKYWPNQMDLNTSDSIRILLRIQGEGYSLAVTTAPMGNYSLAKETPLPYSWKIGDVFGSHTEPFATAHLVATTFSVQSSGLDERPLDISGVDAVEWDWNIIPKNLGTQVINADIDIVWKSKSNGQVIQQVRIWQSLFAIKVTQPFFDRNQLTSGAVASAALGWSSILTSIITWCLTHLGKRWDERADERKKQASKDLDSSGSSPALIASPSSLPAPASASQAPGEINAVSDLSANRSTSTVTPPPSQQGTMRHARLSIHPPIPLVLLTLGCAFLALLAGGGILIYYSSMLGSAQVHPQATPTAAPTVNFIAAEAQRTYDETNSQRPTHTYPLGSESSSSPWLTQVGIGYSCTFAGKAYHIYVSAKGTTDSCHSALLFPQYFTFQVQMRIIKGDYGGIEFQNYAVGDRGGIGFQMNSFPGEVYNFLMKSDGSYELYTSSKRLQSGSLGMMHTGLDQSNVIAITTDVSHIYFFVNQQFVTSVSATPTDSGQLALLGGSAANYPVDVSFSNAQLWIPLSG